MQVGVSGHQLRAGVDWDWVRTEAKAVLRRAVPGGTLWSSLATGADTIAAEEALTAGLALKAVIPHSDYEHVFTGDDRSTFDRLVGACAETIEIGPQADVSEAYLRAGLKVADLSDLMIVVWDGKPAAGRGGTGDIAAYARESGVPVIWLDTTRSEVRAF